jgi:Chaperone of endosialidase
MASAGHRFNRFVRALGGSLGVVVLGTLICADPAAAQCGSSGQNTACGTGALASNTTGGGNSAFGFTALLSNTTGSFNTASGESALLNNTTGNQNTADGEAALFSNTTGFNNTASGESALRFNTTGNDNTASGDNALRNNTGSDNTASGDNALVSNTTGFNNTVSGRDALFSNTTGSFNIGLGSGAGSNIIAGSNNIEIGGAGTSDESNTIRIGDNGTQNATFIAGISATQVTGTAVEVTSDGQLGIAVSSARYKRDIHDMGGASAGLMELRPVTFRYKNDLSATLQYGLVAEEVARVYPELVTRGIDGKVQSVRYLEFTALLLNELQKQAKETRQRLEMKDRQLAAQQREIDALKQKDASVNALSQRLAALEQQIRTATPPGLRSLVSK